MEPKLNREPNHLPQYHVILLIWPLFIGQNGSYLFVQIDTVCGVQCLIIVDPFHNFKIKNLFVDKTTTIHHPFN